jgi:hypothetical protein
MKTTFSLEAAQDLAACHGIDITNLFPDYEPTLRELWQNFLDKKVNQGKLKYNWKNKTYER